MGNPPVLSELRFVALGELSRDQLDRLVAEVSRRVAAPCRVVPTPDASELHGRLLDGRPQLDGDHLLGALEGVAEGPGLVVGVTGRDLGRKIFRFVFGLARSGGPALLVSTARLDPALYGLPADPALSARRASAEVLHELGHAFGAGHCPRADCIMHFAPEVESIDLRGMRFCGSCARDLPEELVSR
jgi:archaemetzincin